VLVQVLVVSSLALVPQQPRAVFGIELLVVAVIAWASELYLTIRSFNKAERQYRPGQVIDIVVGQAATLPFVVAGILFLMGNLAGLYVMVPGTIISYLVAITNAWVLLIEINR
jgi:predicted metal-binding membrane protein